MRGQHTSLFCTCVCTAQQLSTNKPLNTAAGAAAPAVDACEGTLQALTPLIVKIHQHNDCVALLQDKDNKVAYLNKIISVVSLALNEPVPAKPLKVCMLGIKVQCTLS